MNAKIQIFSIICGMKEQGKRTTLSEKYEPNRRNNNPIVPVYHNVTLFRLMKIFTSYIDYAYGFHLSDGAVISYGSRSTLICVPRAPGAAVGEIRCKRCLAPDGSFTS